MTLILRQAFEDKPFVVSYDAKTKSARGGQEARNRECCTIGQPDRTWAYILLPVMGWNSPNDFIENPEYTLQ